MGNIYRDVPRKISSTFKPRRAERWTEINTIQHRKRYNLCPTWWWRYYYSQLTKRAIRSVVPAWVAGAGGPRSASSMSTAMIGTRRVHSNTRRKEEDDSRSHHKEDVPPKPCRKSYRHGNWYVNKNVSCPALVASSLAWFYYNIGRLEIVLGCMRENQRGMCP